MHEVTIFKRYDLEVGQKINIADGPRRGDWLVIGIDDRKMRLRCPVSGKEVEWERFFTLAAEKVRREVWPSVG